MQYTFLLFYVCYISRFTHGYVIVSANINDLKSMAKQIPDSMLQQLVSIFGNYRRIPNKKVNINNVKKFIEDSNKRRGEKKAEEVIDVSKSVQDNIRVKKYQNEEDEIIFTNKNTKEDKRKEENIKNKDESEIDEESGSDESSSGQEIVLRKNLSHSRKLLSSLARTPFTTTPPNIDLEDLAEKIKDKVMREFDKKMAKLTSQNPNTISIDVVPFDTNSRRLNTNETIKLNNTRIVVTPIISTTTAKSNDFDINYRKYARHLDKLTRNWNVPEKLNYRRSFNNITINNMESFTNFESNKTQSSEIEDLAKNLNATYDDFLRKDGNLTLHIML